MSAAPVEEFEVEDLDASGVLQAAAQAEQAERRAALTKLRLAHQWAILNPATAETGVATPGGPALDVLTKNESLGGDGTPTVAAFTPETFALRLGISPAAGARLIGDALDLRHRLPLLWKRVQRLEVPAWQARRVAQQTHALPLAGARWVDQRLAARTDGSLGPVITDRLVALAVAKYDPEAQEKREDNARAASDVKISHPHPTDFAGTSDLAATGDTPTLQAFYDLLCAIAHQMWLDRDTDLLGVRKIKAIALVTAMISGQAARDVQSVLGTAATKQAGKIRLNVLVETDDLDVDAEGAAFAVGTVQRLGAATMAKLRQWVGHHHVEILPVLNMARRDAVDQHDPPEWLRELAAVTIRSAARIAPARQRGEPLGEPARRKERPDGRGGLPERSEGHETATTAPKPHASGATPARPKATTSGTAPTAPPTSSPTPAPTATDHGT